MANHNFKFQNHLRDFTNATTTTLNNKIQYPTRNLPNLLARAAMTSTKTTKKKWRGPELVQRKVQKSQ